MTASPNTFSEIFLTESIEALNQLDLVAVEHTLRGIAELRDRGGRLFVLGVGGSAAHASHAVNDFRKLCGIEAYTPTDNVAELTARINDEGWASSFAAWLEVSRLSQRDGVFVMSVGGGSKEHGVSMNLVHALDYARSVGASVFGIVGRDGGHAAMVADACVIIPTVAGDRVTPHTEGLCAVVWHLIVSHPAVGRQSPKWESLR